MRPPGVCNVCVQVWINFYYPVDEPFWPCASEAKRRFTFWNPCDSPGVRIRALSGLAKLDALREHLYKIRFHDAVRNWPPFLGKMCRLVDTVRVNLVERPREGITIEAVADAIEQDLSANA